MAEWIPSGWERKPAEELRRQTSVSAILDALTRDDPNMRIVASREIAARKSDLDKSERVAAIESLKALLKDGRQNEIEYPAFQCDEETAIFVSASAAKALAALGFAANATDVFQRARMVGIPVVERRDIEPNQPIGEG